MVESKTKTGRAEKKEENSAEKEEASTTYLVPKTHIVFNIDQTEGIPFPQVEQLYRNQTQRIEACEQVVAGMPERPTIEHKGDKASYSPLQDIVTLPRHELFHTDEAYYHTLFHELAHSTGHIKRLNRKELMQSDGFGRELYSKEELTAELCAAYLCGICSIEKHTIDNSAAYIQGWLKALKSNKTLVLKAATQAQAAADYILNLQPLPVAEPLLQTAFTAT